MTHIQRLSIQGIRSFSPDEPQEIRFLPLTIIIGPNGAGKTSIIESLKYVTTGLMPPNSNQGKTFIHDIQFVEEPIIRGQIRLSFIDVENKPTIITRSMQATLKQIKGKPQVTFRQMNAVIKREDKSIDQKLADINTELLELIGVSKAVLNNVIFCHQDDIHWPLSEGKVLKEKFDDIFGSIPFTKALDTIKKCRDEEVVNLKLLEKDVMFTQQIKKEVDQKKKILSDDKTKINFEKEKILGFQSKIDELDSKTTELIKKEQQAEMVFAKVLQLEGSIQEKKKHAEDIEKNCPKELFLLDIDEVDKKLTNFDEDVRQSKSKQIKLQMKLQKIKLQIDQFYEVKQQYSSHIAKINECQNQLKKYYGEFNYLICDLRIPTNLKDQCEFEKDNPDSFKKSSTILQEYLNEKIKDTEISLQEAKMESSKKESQINEKLDSLKNEKSKIAHEIQMRNEEKEKLEKEMNEMQLEFKNNKDCKFDIKRLDNEIRILSNQLEKYGNENDDKKYKKQIEEYEQEKCSLKKELEVLNRQISLANENTEKRIKFEFLKNLKNEKLFKMETIKMKNLDNFLKVNTSNGDFCEKLSALIEKMNGKLKECNSNVSDLEMKIHSESSKLENKKELIFNLKTKLNDIEKKLDGICQPDEFENLLKITEDKLNRLRNEKSALENITPIMNKFIETIEQKKCCPICEHDLSTDWISKSSQKTFKTNDLLNKLKTSKNDQPKEINEINDNIKESEKFYNKLLLLKSEISSINCLGKDIAQYEQDMKMIEETIESLKHQLQTNIKQQQTINAEIDLLKMSMQDAIDYDNSSKELNDVTQKIEQFEQQHQDFTLQLTIDFDELNQKLQQKELEMKKCEDKLSHLQRQLIDFTTQRLKLKDSLQDVEKQKADLEKQQEMEFANMFKFEDLEKQWLMAKDRLKELNEQSKKFDPEIKELQSELDLVKSMFETFSGESQETIFAFKDSLKSLNKIAKEIEHYLMELKFSQLKFSQELLDKMDENLKKFENDKITFQVELDNINKELSMFELNKRNLMDYQTFLGLKKEISKQESILSEIRNKIGSMNISMIRKMRIDAERERQDMITKKESSKSRITELNQKVNELNKELNQDEYRNANERHKQKAIDKVISELACEDLDKYYKALDFAITTFHVNKMQAINKLIEQFWKVSYQAKDIESIQIMADEEERSASDRRRNYNYRVVMIKQSKILDMRGRCSAGQKVLACLIIRMALAIIFSNNFTVITLDEPTTNLDSDNIRAFARAIMTLRKMNKNLQIVIITHDDYFLQCLTNDSVQHYYQVYKDDRGYSTIALKSLQDAND